MFGPAALAPSIATDRRPRRPHDQQLHHRAQPNETVWHAAGAALYAGDIDTFLAHWQPDGRYEVAYPVAGLPPVVTGHDAAARAVRALRGARRLDPRRGRALPRRPPTRTSRSSRST